ncbi:MAG TPA: hypothetical protein DCM68_06410 [Verrucomicrobia bacterium]|nr:hypothetical protein [Verrucomicrobiota bacterium]
MRRSSGFLLVLFFCLPAFAAQTTASFDALLPDPGQHVHTASVSVAAATFVNAYTPEYDSWAGYAFSTVSNTADGTWANQYAAAQARSNAYAVGYHSYYDGVAPEILFDIPAAPRSVRLDNTAYAAAAIRDGSAYNRAFTNGDYFVLTLTANNIEGKPIAATNHYLADFRGGKTFIQTNWSTLDLSWMPPDVASLVGTLTTTDAGAWGPNTPMYFALADFTYAYADSSGGIAATNPAILCWASGVAAYAPGPNADAPYLDPAQALGPASNDVFAVASLGDGGQLTLAFPAPIADGPGPDFAVFENANDDRFLELAFVEVSSDGAQFFRFPSHSLEPDPIDGYCETNQTDPTAYGGLAGKHPVGTGTPFDLRALAGTPGLDVRRVTHVRIRDIPGDGTVTDTCGNPIYDPFPTWGSGGFDLDAIGVLNANLDIAADPSAAPPALPGFETMLEFTPALDPPAWTSNAPPQGTPGFFRYRLAK